MHGMLRAASDEAKGTGDGLDDGSTNVLRKFQTEAEYAAVLREVAAREAAEKAEAEREAAAAKKATDEKAAKEQATHTAAQATQAAAQADGEGGGGGARVIPDAQTNQQPLPEVVDEASSKGEVAEVLVGAGSD